MTPLVLVHGFMGGSAQWSDLSKTLSNERDVIALDLPGFGTNADLAPLNRIEDFAAWAVDDLQARGLSKYHLLGHSMGGMIVQEMARLEPNAIELLVLYATGSVGELPGRFETIDESKRRARADGAEATARRIAATWFLAGKTASAYPACADLAARSSISAILSGLDAMKQWSGEEDLAEISHETLIIWGDQDRTYAWGQIEKLWTKMPNARLAVIPGCAHAVHLEKPEIFASILSDALSI